jgi:hypothetical protein
LLWANTPSWDSIRNGRVTKRSASACTQQCILHLRKPPLLADPCKVRPATGQVLMTQQPSLHPPPCEAAKWACKWAERRNSGSRVGQWAKADAVCLLGQGGSLTEPHAHLVAEQDVVVDDWLDEGVPDGAEPQQRLRQARRQHVAHPSTHVSLPATQAIPPQMRQGGKLKTRHSAFASAKYPVATLVTRAVRP